MECQDIFQNHDYLSSANRVESEKITKHDRSDKVEISIMIPTFKRQDLLKKAIHSALDQITNVTYEIVVIDNNPDEIIDLTEKCFEDKKVSYYRNKKNIGMFGNWNKCILLARGKWILILSDDDEIENDYVEKMYTALSRTDNCGLLSCGHKDINIQSRIVSKEGGLSELLRKKRIIRINTKDFYYYYPIAFCGCLFNREIAIGIGGFNEKAFPCSDMVFMINMSERAQIYNYGENLYKYRWAQNESLNKNTQKDFLLFANLKSYQINNKYKLLTEKKDQFYRKMYLLKKISWLKKQKSGLNSTDYNEIFDCLGMKHEKNIFYLLIYSLEIKIRSYMMWSRRAK